MGLGATVVFRAGEPQQFSYNSTKALAIMLRRLAYPSRLFDQLLFGIDLSTICLVFNSMIELIFYKYRDGIRFNKRHSAHSTFDCSIMQLLPKVPAMMMLWGLSMAL